MADLISVEEKLTHLEKHVAEQDVEIYRLRRQLDDASKAVSKLSERVKELEGGGSDGIGPPADERPPHY